MTEGKKKINRAQRYTEGMLDATEKLVDLVRTRGISVLPPRAVEVIGKNTPTRALLIEAAVRVLLDDANDRASARDIPVPLEGSPPAPRSPSRGREGPGDAFRGTTVMYGGPPTYFDPDPRLSKDVVVTTTTGFDALLREPLIRRQDGPGDRRRMDPGDASSSLPDPLLRESENQRLDDLLREPETPRFDALLRGRESAAESARPADLSLREGRPIERFQTQHIPPSDFDADVDAGEDDR